MKSIRSFLLVSTGLLLLLSLLLSGGLIFDRVRYEVDELFDAELAQTARILRATLAIAETTRPEDLQRAIRVSTHDGSAQSQDETSEQDERTVLGHSYERKILFRILRGHKPVLLTDNFPEVLDSVLTPGYAHLSVGKYEWYLFTLVDGDLTYTVGERSDVREDMIRKIALGYLYPALLAVPVLLLLLAWVMRRGLRPLAALDHCIQQRDKDNLDPILLEQTPAEISPILDSINGLLVRLRRSLDSERRFSATASHEMRTPIAVLKLNVQNALKAQTETERVQLLDELNAGVDRAGRLINQLLTLSRLEQDDHGFARQAVDVLPLLREEMAALYPLALQKRQSIELQVVENVLLLQTVPQLFALLIRNLLDNAIKYSPEDGRIRVQARREAGGLLLIVEDSGPGVPEALRDKIFERFFRLPQSDAPGAGLGLAIVRRVVELLHGQVQAGVASLGGLSVQVRL